MSDHSLLMSPAMVRALSAQPPKSQTRRVLTPDNTLFDGSAWRKHHRAQEWAWQEAYVDGGPSPAGNPGPYLHLPWKAGRDGEDELAFGGTIHRIYPRVQPGDRIWVREAYAKVPPAGVRYPATDDVHELRRIYPSIHMPRWASRWTLFVDRVRIERLHAITPEGAKAEGLSCLSKDNGRTWKFGIPDRDGQPGDDDDGWHWKDWASHPIAAFRRLWNQINEKRGHGWDRNPWVIVIEFTASPANIGPAETKEPK